MVLARIEYFEMEIGCKSLCFAVPVLCIARVGHRCITVAPAESTWVASTQGAVFLFMVNSVNTF